MRRLLLACCLLPAGLTGCVRNNLGAKSDNGMIFGLQQRVLTADCVVTFFKADGSTYITIQHHRITPGTPAIEIRSEEPSGQVFCRLTGGGFESSSPRMPQDNLPIQLCDRELAAIVLHSLLAATGYIPDSSGDTLEMAKIDGQWYRPIKLPSMYSRLDIIVYQNTGNSKMDMVRLTYRQKGITLMARSYTYYWFAELGLNFPMKIDVFSADKAGIEKKRIVQISYQLPVKWD